MNKEKLHMTAQVVTIVKENRYYSQKRQDSIHINEIIMSNSEK